MNLCQGITIIVFLRKAFSEQKQFKIPFENGPCVKLESVFKTFFDVMLMTCRVFYEVFTNVINISLMNFWSLNLFLTCWVKKTKQRKNTIHWKITCHTPDIFLICWEQVYDKNQIYIEFGSWRRADSAKKVGNGEGDDG